MSFIDMFAVLQFVTSIAYIITIIVVGIVYAQQRKNCQQEDPICIQRLNDKFLPAWIVIAILGSLLLIGLWIACFKGDGFSCFIAVIWTLFDY